MAVITMLIAFIPIVFISVFMPYVTRRTESFGVSIPEEIYHSDELKKMRKHYAWRTANYGVLVVVIWLVFLTISQYSIVIFAFLIGSFLNYLIYHKKMKDLKAKENWQEAKSMTVAVDTGFRNQKIAISHWWYMFLFAAALGTFILSIVFYDQFPAKIPLHFNASGEADRWADKSYRSVMLLPLTQLFLSALFLLINTIITKSKQQIDSAAPEKSAAQNKVFRRRWSIFNFLTGLAIVLMMSFLQLSNLIRFGQTLMTIVPVVVAAGIILAAVILSFTTGQGGSRVRFGTPDKKKEAINRDDDVYWKFGIFYFNPNDPSIWVEKRFGIGWTVNFAHPLGWGSLIGIIAVIILLSIFTK
ncbi:MAG TPA: DUF5808 domain-containing protein [Bacillales bacterium]|nr:DUF5808 domain-containing protein [Bacillales bacterium]